MAPEPASLLFPPGAWGLPVPGGCTAGLDQLVWVPCPAVRDPGPLRPEPAAGPSLFETALIAVMRQPFGWLVVAEPTDLLAAETAGLRTELDILRRHRERQADAVERAERCLAERGDFGDGGLWSVRVLAGAASPDDLDVLAPLLAGSAELGLPPVPPAQRRRRENLLGALTSSRHDPGTGAQSPFFVTAGTIAALAGLPRQSVPGLNVTGADPDGRGGASELPPEGASLVRDATRTDSAARADGMTGAGATAPAGRDDSAGGGPDRLAGASLELAVALERGPGPLRIPLAALGHGVLVTGRADAAPGRTIRTILIQLTALGLPWLVVDPAGSGYETVPADGSPVTVINPCDPDALPLTISPLAPEPGYPLQAHIALVRRLLDVAFGADELFSLALSLALPRVYEAAGLGSAHRPGRRPGVRGPGRPRPR